MKRFLVPLILSLVALAAGLIPTASALAAPANDNLASAQVVGPALPIAEAGTTVGATVEAGELHPDDGHSVWFSWTAPAAGPVRVDVCDYEVANGPGNFGLWVYTGNTIATLVEVGSSPNGCKVSFPAISGTAYKISLNSFFEGEGNFTLRLSAETPPPNDNFSSPQARRARPADIADRLQCLLHGRGRRAPPRKRRRNRLPGARQRLVHVDAVDDDRCPDQGLRREHRPSPRRLHGSGARRPDQSHADRPDRHLPLLLDPVPGPAGDHLPDRDRRLRCRGRGPVPTRHPRLLAPRQRRRRLGAVDRPRSSDLDRRQQHRRERRGERARPLAVRRRRRLRVGLVLVDLDHGPGRPHQHLRRRLLQLSRGLHRARPGREPDQGRRRQRRLRARRRSPDRIQRSRRDPLPDRGGRHLRRPGGLLPAQHRRPGDGPPGHASTHRRRARSCSARASR